MTGKFNRNDKRYKEFWENVNDILYIHDLSGRIIDANRVALEVFGYSREDLGKVNIYDIVEKEFIPVVRDGIEEIVKTGKEPRETFEVLCRTKDGRKIWVEARVRPILKEGKVVAVLGIVRDVTLRRKLEERLRESEEMFRAMAEKSLVGIYLIQNGVFKYVNPKMAELWGYKVDELVGNSPLDFVHPEDREIVDRNIKLRIEGKIQSVNYRVRVIRKDGEIRINEVYGSRITFRGKPAIIGTLIDVTEKIKMQEEIERLNKLLRILNEINQLIPRERDVDVLLDMVVRKLSRFYNSTAIYYEGKTVGSTINEDLLEVLSDGIVEDENVLAVPILYEDDVLGWIVLQSKVGFLNDEKEILLTLAENLAFAINATKTEEERWIAFEQIEKNIEQFAILVDQIRNPLAVISLTAELEIDSETRERILRQVKRINELISRLDKGWIESETISKYLKGMLKYPKN